MKNPFKRKAKFPTPPVPRSADDIKKTYFELRARAGELQYQVSILQDELKQLNSGMRELNYEMDARNKLDAAAKETAVQAAPAQAVQ